MAYLAGMGNGSSKLPIGQLSETPSKLSKVKGGLVDSAKTTVLNTRSEVASPNSTMRANANARGTYIDPLTGNIVPANTKLAADHVVPQSWIKALSGFGDLKPGQQSWILNHPLNTQGLPKTFNSSKGAKMPGDWKAYKGTPLAASYIKRNSERGDFLQSFIQNKTEELSGGKK